MKDFLNDFHLSLLDSLKQVIHVVDNDLRLLFFNREMKRWALRHEVDLNQKALGKPLLEVLPFLSAEVGRDYRKVLETGEPLHTRERIQVEERTIDTDVHKIPLIDEKDNLHGVLTVVSDVTERVRAEKALRESEERFRQLAENIKEVFWLTDWVNNKVLYVSPAYQEIWGIPPQALLDDATNWVENIHPEDRDRVYRAFVANAEKGTYDETYRLIRPDGSQRWIHDRAFPITDEQGRVWRVAGLSEDITESRNSQDALRNSEQEKAAILSNITEHVIYHNPQMKILWVNPAAARSLDMEPEELVGRHCYELWGKRDKICEGCPVLKALQTGDIHEGEISTPDGRVWMVRGYPIKDEEGEVIAMVETTLDITERKKVEEALRESEERYRNLVSLAPDGIIVMQDGGIVFANPAAANLLGASEPRMLLGMDALDFIHPDYREIVKDRIKVVLEEGKATSFLEEKLIRLDGKEIVIDSISLPFTFQGRPAIQVLGHDITEHKRDEEALRKRSGELASLLDMSSQVSASLDEQEVSRLMASRATELLDADGCTIYRFDPAACELCPTVTTIKEDIEERLSHRIPLGKGITGKAAKERIPIMANHVHLGEEAVHIPGTSRGPRSVLAAPLLAHGELWGVMTVVRLSKERFAEHDLDLLGLFANQAAAAAANSGLYGRLKESEEKYRSFVEQATDGIVIIQDGKVVFANRAAARLGGYEVEELKNAEFGSLVAPQCREELFQRYQRRTAGKEVPSIYETKLLAKDGRTLDVEINAGTIQYDSEPAVLVFVRDVRERKVAEKALRESEARYRLLASNVTDIIFTMGLDLRFGYISPSVESVLGYSVQEITGTRVQQLLAPDSYQTAVQALEEELQAEERGEKKTPQRTRTMELEVERRDGSFMWVEVRLNFLRDEKDEVNGILGVARDVTQRRNSQRALQESEERYRSLFEDSPISLWEEDLSGIKEYLDELKEQGVSDFETYFDENPGELARWPSLEKIVDVNKAALELYAASSKEELIKSRSQILGPGSEDAVKKQFLAIAEGENVFGCETLNRTLDGENKQISLKMTVVPGYAETLSKVLVSIEDITERKRVEKELRESHQLVLTVLESLDAGVYVSDMETNRILFANGHMRKAFGDIEGKVCWKVLQKDKKGPCEFCTNPKLLDENGEPTGVYAWQYKNPISGYWCEIRDRAIRWIDGRMVRLEIAIDITDRKRAEQALKESEEKYRNLVERGSDGIAIIRDQTLRYVNPKLGRMLGYQPEEMKGRRFADFIDQAELPKVKERYSKRMSGDDVPTVYETVARHKEGGKVFVELNAGVINYDGETADLVFVRDISKRRHAEEALRQREELYRTLVQTAQEGISLVDKEEKFIYVNPKMSELLGYGSQELEGRSLLDFVPDDEAQFVLYESSKRNQGEGSRYETTLIHKDGTPRRVLVNASPLFDSKGRFYATLGVLTDITDLKNVEDELRLRLVYQTAFAQIMNRAIRMEEFDTFIKECLDILANSVEVDRVYLAVDKDAGELQGFLKAPYPESAEPGVYITHLWEKESQGSLNERWLAYSRIPGIRDNLLEDKLTVSSVSGFSLPDREVFTEHRAESVLIAPLYLRDNFFGAIAAEELSKPGRRWSQSETEAFRTAVRLIATILERYFEERERRSAQDALAQSEERYRTLVETSSDIIFLLSASGEPIYCSPAVERIGYAPADVLEQSEEFLKAIPRDDLLMLRALFAKTMRDGSTANDVDCQVYDKWGESHWFALSWNLIREEDGKVVAVQGVARDITGRKETEDALRLRMVYEKALFEISSLFLSEGVSRASLEEFLQRLGKVTGVSRVYLSSHHQGEDGKPFLERIYRWVSEDAPHLENELMDKIYYHQGFRSWFDELSTGEAIHGVVDELPSAERKLFLDEGIKSILVLPIFVEGRFWGAIGFDEARKRRQWNVEDIRLLWTASRILSSALATESKARELALSYEDLQERGRRISELNLRLVKAEEDERRRIAGMLHDEIAQQLTGISLALSAPELNKTTKIMNRLSEAKKLVKETQKFIRDLSYDLRPPVLDNLGLGAAARALARSVAEGTGVSVVTRGEEALPRWEPDTEIMLYRIIQEAVANSINHAEADEITIKFGYQEPLLEVSVEDDGKGFDVEAVMSASRGLGLRSIQERVAFIGGKIQLTSSAGKGTKLRLEVEIPPQPNRITAEE